jgi:PAS domain-containing protein
MVNISFSVAILIARLVASDWKLTFYDNRLYDRISEGFLRSLPIITVLLSSVAIIIVSSNPHPNIISEQLVYFGGVIVIVLAIFRQHHQLQERDRLLEAQTEAHVLFYNTPMPLAFADNQANIINRNAKFLEIIGYDQNEVPTINEWYKKVYPDKNYRKKCCITLELLY